MQPYEYDLTRAKELLAMAGYDVGDISPIDTTTSNSSDSSSDLSDTSSPTVGEDTNTTSPEFIVGPSFVSTLGIAVMPMIIFYFTRKKQTDY